jgi:hypothetical protein
MWPWRCQYSHVEAWCPVFRLPISPQFDEINMLDTSTDQVGHLSELVGTLIQELDFGRGSQLLRGLPLQSVRQFRFGSRRAIQRRAAQDLS